MVGAKAPRVVMSGPVFGAEEVARLDLIVSFASGNVLDAAIGAEVIDRAVEAGRGLGERRVNLWVVAASDERGDCN